MADLTASDQERIAALDATEQAALVREGELTAEELVSTAIARIERLNPTLNAVITTAFDEALATVKDGTPTGPLGGVPILMKDLVVEVKGMRFCEGSRFLRDNVSTVDSELVARLRRAGLVILGKSNTSEFGMTPTVEPLLFGATRNPWDTDRTTGGSSGGSGAAVASGMVPVAHANDLGGSIRIPASCCGLFGLKPTRARNPLGPVYGDIVGGLGAEHALTRSVRDSAALLDATSGPDLGDPYRPPVQPGPFVDEIRRDPRRLRVAYTSVPAGGRSVHRDCRTAVVDAAALCEELGHHVFERDLVELTPEVNDAIGVVWRSTLAWLVRYWVNVLGREPEEDELEPYTAAYYERGRHVSAGEYLLAVTQLQAFSRRVAAAYRDFDVWLSPTLAQPPLPLGAMTSTKSEPFAGIEEVDNFVAFPLVVANVTGCPAMSVPLFWSSSGLPIGVNFMARFGHEHTLFRLAGQLEQARPWGFRRPPVW
ncbi:MAG: amidase [Nocardioidaceae bacterium]